MINQFIEYNFINNIPIVSPLNKQNFVYCSRYTIVDASKIYLCFSKQTSHTIIINNVCFKYIKITIDKSYKTYNPSSIIKALHYYIVIPYNVEFNINVRNYDEIFEWLLTKTNDNIFIITTPVFQFQHVYYSIANNNIATIIRFCKKKIDDDEYIINQLIKQDCFTICDNNIIIIGLYHLHYLSSRQFIYLYESLKQTSLDKFTHDSLFFLMNRRKVVNICDFPIFFLLTNPYNITDDIHELYLKSFVETKYIYSQKRIQNNMIFSSLQSAMYPNISSRYIKHIYLNENIYLKYFGNIYVSSDFYGMFTSIIKSKKIWEKWLIIQNNFMTDIFKVNQYNKDFLLIDILYTLFYMYEHGYNDIKLKKKRIRIIWRIFLQRYNIIRIQNMFELFIALHKRINIPYVFLLDIYQLHNINYSISKPMLIEYNSNFIYKKTSIYNVFNTIYDSKELLFIFKKQNFDDVIFNKILAIYERFDMFSNNKIKTNSLNIVGELLIHYVKTNIELLL